MKAIDWILLLNEICYGFWSNEKPKSKASNSEIKRWFNKGSIKINDKVITNPYLFIKKIDSIILFPKNDSKRISFTF